MANITVTVRPAPTTPNNPESDWESPSSPGRNYLILFYFIKFNLHEKKFGCDCVCVGKPEGAGLMRFNERLVPRPSFCLMDRSSGRRKSIKGRRSRQATAAGRADADGRAVAASWFFFRRRRRIFVGCWIVESGGRRMGRRGGGRRRRRRYQRHERQQPGQRPRWPNQKQL